MAVPSVISGLSVTARCSDSSITVAKILQGDTSDTTNSLQVVKAATANTQVPLGVSISETDAADENVVYAYSGIVNINVDGSGSAIDIGNFIVATTGGQGVIAPTLDATNRYAVGIALAPSAADGDLIPVQLTIQHLVKGTA